MEDDADEMTLTCARMLRYADAKRIFDGAQSEKELEAYQKNKLMKMVEKNWFELRAERRAAKAAAAKPVAATVVDREDLRDARK